MNPMLPDAYSTLALVYEALDDPKKSFNFSLLAAHLTPKVHPTYSHALKRKSRSFARDGSFQN